MQGKLSNFDTDLFTPLIAKAAELTGTTYKDGESRSDASLRIIADHSRAATFLISDGVLPANEGRGYVLRKILRRGIRHGRLLGQEKPFMYQMVYAVRDDMQNAYPELKDSADRVSKVVEAEERQFARAVSVGLARLESELAPLLGKTGIRLSRVGRLPSLRNLWSSTGLYGRRGARCRHCLRHGRL